MEGEGGGGRAEALVTFLPILRKGGKGGGGGRPEGSTNSSEKLKLMDIKDVKAFANLYIFFLHGNNLKQSI